MSTLLSNIDAQIAELQKERKQEIDRLKMISGRSSFSVTKKEAIELVANEASKYGLTLKKIDKNNYVLVDEGGHAVVVGIKKSKNWARQLSAKQQERVEARSWVIFSQQYMSDTNLAKYYIVLIASKDEDKRYFFILSRDKIERMRDNEHVVKAGDGQFSFYFQLTKDGIPEEARASQRDPLRLSKDVLDWERIK